MAVPSLPTLSISATVTIGALALGIAILAVRSSLRGRRSGTPGEVAGDPREVEAGPVTAAPTPPRSASAAVARAGEPPSGPELLRRSRPDGPIEALLAEDNDVNALVLTRLLEKLGCSVTRAATGADAVTAAGKGLFEIVFMDWRMPEMDGLEAIRHIRRIKGYARVPIVAVTANALPGDRETCLRAGADDYVTKPVDAARLRATLARFALALETADPA